jgi:hypothetical protein
MLPGNVTRGSGCHWLPIGPIVGSEDSAAGTVQSQTRPLAAGMEVRWGATFLGELAHVVGVPFLGAEKLSQGGSCGQRTDLMSQDD